MLTTIFFSPGGTTAKVAGEITAAFSEEARVLDLLRQPARDSIRFSAEDAVVVAIPVFSGRIPAVCAEMLARLSGDSTPAVAAVVYGNRAFEDALLELTTLLKARGFLVAGAGAFIGRHSIFPKVAEGRPDAEDLAAIRAFAERSAGIIAGKNIPADISVPGNYPYRPEGEHSMRFETASRCTGCGTCAALCPVGAIPAANPAETDAARCIRCTACLYACPEQARSFAEPHSIAAKSFAERCGAYLKPEVFYPVPFPASGGKDQ